MVKVLRQGETNSDPTTESPPLHSQLMLLSRAKLVDIGIRYSNVHLLKLESEGKFPRRITLSPGFG